MDADASDVCDPDLVWPGRAKACNTLLAASITGLAQVAVNARTAINALAVLKGISAVIHRDSSAKVRAPLGTALHA